MSGNEFASTVLLDVFDLEVTGDPSPEAGTATEVTVSFRFSQPFYGTFLHNPTTEWPFEVKVYAEGLGDWAREQRTLQNGTCNQADPEYRVAVPVTLDREGVYLISALVELGPMGGWVMGWSDKEARITVWTAG